MKTGFITTMLLLFAAGMAQAQDNQAKIDGNPNVNTIVVNTTGDVTIYQGDKFDVKWGDDMVHYNMNFELKDSVVYLSGTDDFEVTMPMLKYLEINSVGDVVARDEIVAKNISICSNGSGDVDLNLICSNIYLRNNGSGDVTLRGNANALMVETKGKGTNNAVKLKHSVSIINGYGQKNDELAVLRVGGEGTVNQYNPNSEGWLYETRQFAEFLDARLSWTCQKCAAFTFERVGNEWALKGVENIPQESENARLMRSAAPFFDQEQHRNRSVHETEGRTQDNQAKIDGNPNVNTIVVNTTGDVTICQGDKFAVKWDNETVHYNMNFELKDSVAYLSGTDDFEVTMPMLKYLEVNSAGNVVARDEIVAKNISICSNGSGDVDLNLICSNIYLRNSGSGDVTLRGNANALMVETFGSGDFNAVNLKHSVSFVNATGSGEGDLGKVRKMVFVHNSNHDASQVLDNCSVATSLGSPIVFEQVESSWRIKGYEHLDLTKVANEMCSAAPFFGNEQHRNWNAFNADGMTQSAENESTATVKDQLDEDLGDLIKDITVGISKGSRENWSEEQWDAWADSLEMRAKEIERQAKKMEKSIETTTKSHVNVNINRPSPYEYRGLLYDANWAGFEAGLNILTPGNLPEWMGLRQMRSWCFNINIADVGIAFNRQHSMGIFTGIGIGWNNYSFNKPMFFEKDAEGYLNATPILDEQGLPLNIDRSKIGVFYAQMPLMIEFKPFRQRMYIDLGVTCGMRITSWQTIEFGRNYGKYAILGEGENAELIAADKTRDLQHKDLCVNFFKVDATLRAGSVSDDIGFFVKYSLLPLFTEGKVKDADGNVIQNVYPLNIGFSLNF